MKLYHLRRQCSPQEQYTNKSPSTRHEKPPLEFVVRVVQVTPKTIQAMAVAPCCFSEVEGSLPSLYSHFLAYSTRNLTFQILCLFRCFLWLSIEELKLQCFGAIMQLFLFLIALTLNSLDWYKYRCIPLKIVLFQGGKYQGFYFNPNIKLLFWGVWKRHLSSGHFLYYIAETFLPSVLSAIFEHWKLVWPCWGTVEESMHLCCK